MRVVIAEDAAMLREGLVRLLDRPRPRGARRRGRRRRAASPRWPSTVPTSPWSTSGCRRPTPTRACAPPSSIRRDHPDTGVLVFSQYIETRYATQLLAERRRPASATCSRTASPTSAEFVDALARVAAGGTALDPEVVGQLIGAEPARRGPGRADPARARGARADGRGPVQRRDRGRRSSSPAGRSRSTWPTSSPSSACRRRKATTAGSSPSCATSGPEHDAEPRLAVAASGSYPAAMAEMRPAGTLGDVLMARRRRRFVGRASEIELFRAALDSIEPPFSVLHVHGPPGIGKTRLLDVFAALAAGACRAGLCHPDLPAAPRRPRRRPGGPAGRHPPASTGRGAPGARGRPVDGDAGRHPR